MAYTIEIGGVDKTAYLQAGTLNVNRRSDHRHTCSLSLTTTAAGYLPDVGEDLKVKDAGTVIFGGVIQTADMVRPGVGTTTGTTIQLNITSDGYNSIPQRRTLNVQFDDVDAVDVITYCLIWLADEGITAGTVSTGAHFDEYDAVCKSVFEILNDMAEASGYKWYIDDNKALQFYQEDAVVAAEHVIEIGGAFTDYQITSIEKTLDEYSNKIFLRGGIGDDGYIVTAIEEDAAEQTARQTIEGGAGVSSGVYGLVISDSEIDNSTDAATAAANELKKRCRIPTRMTFTSHTLDWTAGKKLTVNLPIFGISVSEYYLTEEVSIEDFDGLNMKATISATLRNESDFSTQRTQTGIDYFAKLAKKESSSGTGGLSTVILKSLVKDYNATNSSEVTVNTSEDTIVTKTLTLDVKSDIKVIFTCQGLTDDALSLTLKTYIGGVARTLQPIHEIFGANKVLLTLTDSILAQAAGSVTIVVKGTTSNGNFVIAANFATVDILVIPLVAGYSLGDVIGFDLTVIDHDEIDASWTNPPTAEFTGVELYRHSADLASHDRAWCDANATLVYSGTDESYNNTGLDPDTLYYYKIFAVYESSGTYYSPGLDDSATTEEAPAYQQWENYPDSPLLTVDWPYQSIGYYNFNYNLIMSKGKQAKIDYPGGYPYDKGIGCYGSYKIYLYNGVDAWMSDSSGTKDIGDFGLVVFYNTISDIQEANNDIYTDSGLGTVYFAKTTP